MNTDARRAAWRLTQTAAPIVMRTWHGVQILDGAHHGSGRRGFLVGLCEHHNGHVRVLLAGGGPIVCCLPLHQVAGFTTLHGGKPCPGNACTEGTQINLEEATA